MSASYVLQNDGYCPICEGDSVFRSTHTWLRDNYKCEQCESIPRNRALVMAFDRYVPNWRHLTLHEAGPGGSASTYIQSKSRDYTASHLLPDVEPGTYSQTHKTSSQNLESLTFGDNEFDLFITQDVFEHVMQPEKAFSEIARVLTPGGLHVFTLPWYPDEECSRYRVKTDNGELVHLAPPQYHGNPISAEGSLVTVDYGRDIQDIIFAASGMSTIVHLERDRHFGLDGEFLEVFISRKPMMK